MPTKTHMREEKEVQFLPSMAKPEKCKNCGAKRAKDPGKELFVRMANGNYRCTNCTFENSTKMSRINKSCIEVYKQLQLGKFEEVLRRVQSIKNEIRKERISMASYKHWLNYVECRAEFRILGPLVDNEVCTGFYTPCNIDIFSIEKMKESNFITSIKNQTGKKDDDVESIFYELTQSVAEYQEMLENYREKGPNMFFDVFICHKTDALEGKGRTEDYELGLSIYQALTRAGYNVFFAPETSKKMRATHHFAENNNNWRKWIYDAMLTSRVMIVVASNDKYLTMPNVQNEWVTFRDFIRTGFYGKKAFLPVFGGDVNCRKSCMQLIFEGGKEGNATATQNFYDNFFTLHRTLFGASRRLNAQNLNGWMSKTLKKLGRPTDLFVNHETEKMETAKSLETQGLVRSAVAIYKELWDHYRTDEAAVRMGLIQLRDNPKSAVNWFKKGQTAEADAHYAFCLFKGIGGRQQKLEAYKLLTKTDEESYTNIETYYRALCFAYTKLFEEQPTENMASGDAYAAEWFDKDEGFEAIHRLKGIINTFYPAKKLYALCLSLGIYCTTDLKKAQALFDELAKREANNDYKRLIDGGAID